MKDERRNYIIAGFFVMTMVVGLVLWLALLSGGTGATDAYWVRYPNVMGLNAGTKVLFEGFPVGSVDSVAPLPASLGGGFRVDIVVQEDWPIPEDSVAAVTAGGLLAAVVINIRAGESQEMLPPGDEIESSEAGSLLGALASVAEQVKNMSEGIEPILDSLAVRIPTIMDETQELVTSLSATAKRLDAALSAGNVKHVDNIFANLDQTVSNTAKLSADLQETRRQLDTVLASIDSTIVDNREDLRRSVIDLRSSLEQISRYIPTIAQNLESSMRNLNEFTGVIRENPGVLLRGRRVGDDPGSSR
jgi:phospholipid/cholesterol/gamma-HCH transport system substrate-binding protein